MADFAEMIGEPLLPHQEWLAKHALELNADGTYRFRTVVSTQARQNGKTTFLRTLALWRLYLDGAALVLGAAQDRSIAIEAWRAAVAVVDSCPELAAEKDYVRSGAGDEHLRLVGGGRYKVVTASRSSGRGLSADLLIMDEIREQRTWDAWSALSKTTMARPFAQIWCISNAGDDESVVLNGLREAALSGRDPSIGLFEWSAEDGCELDDPVAWAQANPGLGYTVSEAAIRSALATDPPEIFRTEVLCQRVDALDSAVDLPAWRDCRDVTGTLNDHKDRLAACVDVSRDAQHVTLVVAAVLPDGRVRGEVKAAWDSTQAARAGLAEELALVGPVSTAWFPSGPAAALAPILREAPGAVELKGQDVLEACMGLADLVKARRVVHPDDPLLNAHVAGSAKYWQGDGWRFARRGGVGHCDGAYAFAGAVRTAMTLPVRRRARLVVAGQRDTT